MYLVEKGEFEVRKRGKRGKRGKRDLSGDPSGGSGVSGVCIEATHTHDTHTHDTHTHDTHTHDTHTHDTHTHTHDTHKHDTHNTHNTHNTHTHEVFTYTHGSAFGELSVMYGKPRAASVVAKSDGALWTLGRCHVIELHKRRLFIYIPYAKDQIWTFNLVYIYGIR
jgi:CRP-like cAMP-binding protein